MKLRVVAAAEREALKAAFWYNKQRSGLGDDFLLEVDECVIGVANDPQQHTPVEMGRSRREVRCSLVKRFPYAVYFEVLPAEIVVLAVAHTSRRPFYWRSRK